MNPASRIYFKGSAFPDGHRIDEFVWTGRLDPATGIWFDFHLQTAPYDEQETSDDTGEDSWTSKMVWTNYSRCIMSSSYWNDHGFLAATKENKLDFETLGDILFSADTLPRPETFDINEDTAFNIYLLGHDDCADHEITFPYRGEKNRFDISWKGKIALAYSGQYEHTHEFDALIRDVEFGGIKIPDAMLVEQAYELLAAYVAHPRLFEADKNDRLFRLKE